jgi:signal transduction histidine kinase
MELLPIQLAQQAMYYLEKALRTGETQTFTCQYLLPGRVRDWQIRITRSGPGEVLALVRDVTDHKVLEKEIVEITNKVQARIGQDLHDGLGQHLTGITFLTRALENKLSAKSLPEAADAAEVGRLVIQALSQTRNLARGLFPVELESNGLIPAFRELATTVENLFSISCVLECDENLKVTNLAVATHLFRLAQEAINNSVKHGKAKRVVVRLHKADGKVVLAISDDGQGFPRKEIKLNGLGLRIMNYRSQKIGATLDIQPGERGGTVVTCSLPNAGRE